MSYYDNLMDNDYVFSVAQISFLEAGKSVLSSLRASKRQ